MPAILLHVCCGPCACRPAQYLLEQGFEVRLWFMNPNIQPLSEYLRRREAAELCAQKLGLEIIFEDETWNLTAWLQTQLLHVEQPQRCQWCTGSRLEAARDAARRFGCDYFSSSLFYSIYQPHAYMLEKGRELAQTPGPEFYYHDFREFWQEGIDLSREWQLYRQPYCGCVFSESERYTKKLQKLLKK